MSKTRIILIVLLSTMLVVFAWFARQSDIRKHLRPAAHLGYTQPILFT